MTTPIRLTPQMQQEEISRHQLCECLVRFGWLPVSPKDLGEDFMVHIYVNGIAKGVVFHVQQKSVTNICDRKKGDNIEYRFEVKDLLHWEGFDLPVVVLIVWDINQREGRWVLLDTVVRDLDKRRPTWRRNKTKTKVKIPWTNDTSDIGLTMLRQAVGSKLLPIIAQNRDLEINVAFQFPDTEQGRQAKEAYESFHKRGDEVTLEGRIIQRFEVSDWAKPWIGWYDPDKVAITMEKSLSNTEFPVEISFLSDEDETIALPRTSLKAIKVGSVYLEVSNQHQEDPFHFWFSFDNERKQDGLNFRLISLGNDAYRALEVLRFSKALSIGGVLRVALPTIENSLLTYALPPQPNNFPIDEYFSDIEKLCKIQDRIKQLIRVPKDDWFDDDTVNIRRLHKALSKGFEELSLKRVFLSVTKLRAKDLLNSKQEGASIFISQRDENFTVTIFNQGIKVGPRIEYVQGTLVSFPAELLSTTQQLNNEDTIQIELMDAKITRLYPDLFTIEAKRIAQLLRRKLGIQLIYQVGKLLTEQYPSVQTPLQIAISNIKSDDPDKVSQIMPGISDFNLQIIALDAFPSEKQVEILKGSIKL